MTSFEGMGLTKGLPGPGATAGSITATTAAARIVDLATHIEEAPRARDILEERVHAARIIRMLTKELHPDIHPERSRDWHLFVEAKHTLERHHGSR